MPTYLVGPTKTVQKKALADKRQKRLDLGETAARRSFCLRAHVRYWHLADIGLCAAHVR
jgi:hypothetical protein